MNTLKTIRDSDFKLDNPDPSHYKERRASRAVVFDREKNIALLRITKKYFHKLPGGGIEDGESIADALEREQRRAGVDEQPVRAIGARYLDLHLLLVVDAFQIHGHRTSPLSACGIGGFIED